MGFVDPRVTVGVGVGGRGPCMTEPRPLILHTGLFPQHGLCLLRMWRAPHLQNRLVTLIPGIFDKELTFDVRFSPTGGAGLRNALTFEQEAMLPSSEGVWAERMHRSDGSDKKQVYNQVLLHRCVASAVRQGPHTWLQASLLPS